MRNVLKMFQTIIKNILVKFMSSSEDKTFCEADKIFLQAYLGSETRHLEKAAACFNKENIIELFKFHYPNCTLSEFDIRNILKNVQDLLMEAVQDFEFKSIYVNPDEPTIEPSKLVQTTIMVYGISMTFTRLVTDEETPTYFWESEWFGVNSKTPDHKKSDKEIFLDLKYEAIKKLQSMTVKDLDKLRKVDEVLR